MKPSERFIFLSETEWSLLNPVIPVNVFAFCTDTRVWKRGDGSTNYNSLPVMTGTHIGNKRVMTSREPIENEIPVFCVSEDKWIFRLVGCHLTETECGTMGLTVYPKFTIIVEIGDISGISTGRIKIGDGVTHFADLQWIGAPSADIIAHLSDHTNPHEVTKAQVGLSDVTNDAQLTRADGDFSTFEVKPSLESNDVLLIEDSSDGGTKKRITVGAIEELIISYVTSLGG